MRKIVIAATLVTSMAVMTCCSGEDPFEDFIDNGNWTGGGMTPGGSGNSYTTGELATFDISLDNTSAEPETTAAEYFPEEEDALENNTFAIEVAIDLTNPSAKTENGVEVTVSGGHVTANHGTTKGICYVVSGTTANGSLTIVGDKKYAVRPNF